MRRVNRALWKGWNPFSNSPNPGLGRQPRKSQLLLIRGDLFDPHMPDMAIVGVLSLIAEAKNRVFLALTRNPDRMRAFLTHRTIANDVWVQTSEGLSDKPPQWPLDNLWLGVVVRNQEKTDQRIPALVATPAAKRCVFCAPVGPVSLDRWLPHISPWSPTEVPLSWQHFKWPDWVPFEVRSEIEGFWAESVGRGPKEWIQNMLEREAPPTGEVLTLPSLVEHERVTGRFIHAWNNIGRIITADGAIRCVCHAEGDLLSMKPFHARQIHWVVCRSGRKATPLHPDWARTLRDQSLCSGVPFHFEGWGDWLPCAAPRMGIEDYLIMTPDGVIRPGKWKEAMQTSGLEWAMAKVGASKAGCLLDDHYYWERPSDPRLLSI